MRKWIMLGVTMCLAVLLIFQGTGVSQGQKTGGVNLVNGLVVKNIDNDPADLPILFTLFKDGVVVRSAELSSSSYVDYAGRKLAGAGEFTAAWKELPVGPYELHCEAVGYGKLIKRIAVSSDTPAQIAVRTMPEKDEMQGAGPTLFEMQRKITLLENENAALKERVAALEKAK